MRRLTPTEVEVQRAGDLARGRQYDEASRLLQGLLSENKNLTRRDKRKIYVVLMDCAAASRNENDFNRFYQNALNDCERNLDRDFVQTHYLDDLRRLRKLEELAAAKISERDNMWTQKSRSLQARALYQLGETEACQQSIDKQKNAPLEEQALSLQIQQRYSEAAALYHKALQQNCNNIPAFIGLGECLVKSNGLSQAVAELEMHCEKNGKKVSYDIIFRFARWMFDYKLYQQTVALFVQLIFHRDECGGGYENLALCYKELNLPLERLKVAAEGCTRFPDNQTLKTIHVHALIGLLHQYEEEVQDTQIDQLYAEHCVIHQGVEKILLAYLVFFRNLVRTRKENAHYKKMRSEIIDKNLALIKSDAELRTEYANYVYDTLGLERALEELEVIQHIFPQFTRGYLAAAYICRDGDNDKMAEKYFNLGLQHCGPHKEAYLGLSIIAYMRDDISQADSEVERALAMDPNYSSALSQKGHILQDRRRDEEAREYFQRASHAEIGRLDRLHSPRPQVSKLIVSREPEISVGLILGYRQGVCAQPRRATLSCAAASVRSSADAISQSEAASSIATQSGDSQSTYFALLQEYQILKDTLKEWDSAASDANLTKLERDGKFDKAYEKLTRLIVFLKDIKDKESSSSAQPQVSQPLVESTLRQRVFALAPEKSAAAPKPKKAGSHSKKKKIVSVAAVPVRPQISTESREVRSSCWDLLCSWFYSSASSASQSEITVVGHAQTKPAVVSMSK